MKAFLLAAGHGTRLRPLTNKAPKCLLPVRGVPMLEIWIHLCQRFAIHDVLLNLHSHADCVQAYLESRDDIRVCVNLVTEPTLLGSAGTLRANRQWVEGEECFWIFYADVLVSADLDAMLRFHRSRHPIATLGLYRVPDPTRCGVVSLSDNETIQNFTEKPAVPMSNLAFAGIMLGTPALLDSVPQRTPVDIGYDLLPALTGKMMGYCLNGYILDIGTMQNYQLAQTTWPGIASR